MDVVTLHFNTPEMMDVMIRSVNKHTRCTIHVIDNSDQFPFVNTFDNVNVIDNTKGQIIDFDRILERYPERRPGVSNYGSAKHCLTVDWCFNEFDNGFILMDSDILLKKDVSELWDESVVWSGEPFLDCPKGVEVMRVLPFLCFINVPFCKRYGVRYFNGEWMWHLTRRLPNYWFDTGAWFYKDTMEKCLPCKEIRVGDYCEHYFHGSHGKFNQSLPEWIKKYKDLWI